MWWYPVIGIVLFVFLIRFWMRRRIQKPPAPPFEIQADDPLFLEAIAKARESVDQLRELYVQRPRDSYVKISCRSEAGVTEHLWGQLLDLTADRMRLKPTNLHPAYHGPLEDAFERPLSDLEDWQVELPDGMIRGGYTIKVMFQRVREQDASFPDALAEQQSRYLDHRATLQPGRIPS